MEITCSKKGISDESVVKEGMNKSYEEKVAVYINKLRIRDGLKKDDKIKNERSFLGDLEVEKKERDVKLRNYSVFFLEKLLNAKTDFEVFKWVVFSVFCVIEMKMQIKNGRPNIELTEKNLHYYQKKIFSMLMLCCNWFKREKIEKVMKYVYQYIVTQYISDLEIKTGIDFCIDEVNCLTLIEEVKDDTRRNDDIDYSIEAFKNRLNIKDDVSLNVKRVKLSDLDEFFTELDNPVRKGFIKLVHNWE